MNNKFRVKDECKYHDKRLSNISTVMSKWIYKYNDSHSFRRIVVITFIMKYQDKR